VKERWCAALEAVLSPETNERRASVYVVQGMHMSTGEVAIWGVAARKNAKTRGVFFNCCPFCGTKLNFFTKKHGGPQ
jgi:hypothetical protein